MADPKTLDIKEPQILQHFPADAGGFYWHHRVLLEKCAAGVWIGLSPDGDLERIDLNITAHVALDRKAAFPAPQAAYVYAFDEMSRGELEGYRRRARIMNNLFNDAGVAEVDGGSWVIADVTHEKFGEKISDELLDDGVVFRDSGLVELDGDEVYVKRIDSSKLAEWIVSKEKSKGDLRLLGDFKDGQGGKFLAFDGAVDLLRNSKDMEWNLSGPRAFIEYIKAIRSGATDLVVYHLNWVRNSGINQYSAAVHEHRILCDSIKAFLQVDQIDCSNLLGCEILARRLIQIETATARSPTSPDYSGLELIMEQPIGSGGEASVLKFSEWLGGRLKERATVQKQARLYREEFANKRSGGDHDDGGGAGKGRGRGRGRGNKSAAAKAAASTS